MLQRIHPNKPGGRQYTGRFAPSPTGPLHAGSLVAALASYLDARAHHGKWLVRLDDIDPPRQQAGAIESIIHCLMKHGLEPDEVDYQSRHTTLYEHVLARLDQRGLLFRCTCTRATLGPNGVCIRDCQQSTQQNSLATSLRVKVSPGTKIAFDDLIHGYQSCALFAQQTNFIVKRRDGLYAYQLASACDDGDSKITHVIRGVDLLDSTFKHIHLQQALGLKTPQYGHLPLVYGTDGSKLSKQTGAKALDNRYPEANLARAAAVLGLPPSPKSIRNVSQQLTWLTSQWRYDRVTR